MKGIVLSKGIGIGKTYIFKKSHYEIPKEVTHDIKKEMDCYEAALKKTSIEIESLVQKAKEDKQDETAAVFEAHLFMLQDPQLDEEIKSFVISQGYNIVHAVYTSKLKFMDMMLAIDDDYFKERAKDVDEVCTRLIENLLGIETKSLENFEEDTIIIADELLPGQVANIDTKKVKGIIMAQGGKTSHSAIIANNLGIPSMVAPSILDEVEQDQLLVLDCIDGDILIAPDDEAVQVAISKMNQFKERQNALLRYKDVETYTKDKVRVEVVANISTPEDLETIKNSGAEGIGLFRSEFIYMDRETSPTEEEQFIAYRSVLEGMDDKPVIIRTFDIGGDKQLSYYPIEREENPFMGYRAIRICLEDIELFKIQLRAILRASCYGNCKIMFPMISSVAELREAKAVLKEVMDDLSEKGITYNPDISVGIMVEIPSVAVTAHLFAEEVDFFSIGTNDLTQYTLAADRMNQKVNKVYDSFNPGVLQLITHTIRSSKEAGIQVGMCGEMAGEPLMIPYLIGLGINELSMSAGKILEAKNLVNQLDTDEMKKVVDKVNTFKTSEEIKKFLSAVVNDIEGRDENG